MISTTNQAPKTKSNWLRLFHFVIIWSLSVTFFYVLIVIPFYPESIHKYNEVSENEFSNDYLFLLLTQLASLLGTIATFWFIHRRDKNYLTKKIKEFDFGLFYKGSIVSLVITILCLLIMISCGFISLQFLNIINLPLSILFFLIVAICEEAVFRGYLIPNLQEKMNNTSVVLLSSFIFALVHISNPNFSWIGFINIFAGGILMAILYLHTNNLSTPIGVHFAWNLMQSIFGFAVSGLKLDGIFSLEHRSSIDFINGGEFGMEGSILLTPIILVSILVISRKDYFKNISSINI